MAGADAFKVEGLVVEVLSSRTYRLQLANGHRLLGFVPGSPRVQSPGLVPGAKVRLELSPYDLSQGRIVLDKLRV